MFYTSQEKKLARDFFISLFKNVAHGEGTADDLITKANNNMLHFGGKADAIYSAVTSLKADEKSYRIAARKFLKVVL